MKFVDLFLHLHPAVQASIVVSMLILLTVIAMNHSAGENLTNLLLAVQTIIMGTLAQKRKKENK